MKRIFIAVRIEPGEVLLNILSNLRARLSNENIKWTNPANFHITLLFIGDTEEDKLADIDTSLRKICKRQEAFDLKIKGAGVFKSFSDPRVIWIGIEPSDNLSALRFLITNELQGTWQIGGESKFNPHITVGRIKSIKADAEFKILLESYRNTMIQNLHVSEVILYESTLLPSGAVYSPLKTYRLD